MFFLPRLSTIWGSYLSPLPRWMRANTLKETVRNLKNTGVYPPESYDPLSYYYGTGAISGYGPTWGPLAGPFIAVGPGANPPDSKQSDSLLARTFTSLWPFFNHLSYQETVLELYWKSQYPLPSLDKELWKATGQAPQEVYSVEILRSTGWELIPEVFGLFELLWRSTPAWMLSHNGLFVFGIEFKEDWAVSKPPSLEMPDPDDIMPDTDVWLLHPRTSQWLRIPSIQVEDGVFSFFWEPDTPLPKVRWQSVSLSTALSSSGVIKLNNQSFSDTRFQETLIRTLEKTPIWNPADELALTYGAYRKSQESNSDLWERLSYQIGYFTGQSNRQLALQLSNQFGLLQLETITSSTLSWNTSGCYFLLPELPREKYITEKLTITGNPQEFRSKYESPSYALYEKGLYFLTGSASAGLVSITQTLTPSALVKANWTIPLWSETTTGLEFYTDNLPEEEYDLFIASGVDCQLHATRQKLRKWTSYEEETPLFNGIATFD